MGEQADLVKQEVKLELDDEKEGDDLKLGDDENDDDDNIEVLLLPDATVLLSSRLGGRAASPTEIKQEPIELDDIVGEQGDLEDEEVKDFESVGVMSDSN